MTNSFVQLLRSRWFVWLIHAILWVMLYLAAMNLGGKAPAYQDATGLNTGGTPATVPVFKLDTLFSPAVVLKCVSSPTNFVNPFFTKHFQPAATVPPPPPTTRKIEVTYQGFYQTEGGPKFAVLNVAGGLMAAKVGALIATNVYVADANMQTVILTNTAAQTNTLPLNAKKEIEVPVR